MRSITQSVFRRAQSITQSLLGAVAFYTAIPLPACWGLDFQRVARWAALVGVAIGGILGAIDLLLAWSGMPALTRSALVVVLWVWMTGGLHLDGAIDTADGLAVLDPQRRLTVMRDSVVGAFGAIAGAAILVLKTAALSEISTSRWLCLMAAASWSRWGQVAAIAFYPYLHREGTGRFHKDGLQLPQDLLLGLAVALAVSGAAGWLGFAIASGGAATALISGAWLYRCLGGHTGDTYGAVVEWTEVMVLCWLTCWFG
ncbi:cobalamin 5'-phosphate synthase/cobalamin synthase [Rubidibacter lacunae KORDI 51-2]|uniref:Adenosylcobinamide-GDP ribazoletransferase n=1 Tax=Rubidibacter lacunae KORDI 51-2 TaxID=582515 RepID=U5DQD0_9CHRO|nr:adenosylcobinamide-GDP ribazoletransferase [Rubidibacter lacunae]ERN42824.1 cobalamin 5'-phosphate synthase/cobalamin synthase [Rubidibacter lacunae KORDI 51-2]